MAQSQLSTLESYVKTTFGVVNSTLWEDNTLQRLFPFLPASIVSDYYEEPVELNFEQGYTRAGNLNDVTLRPAISQEAGRAKIRPSQILGRKRISYRDEWRQSEAGYASFISENEYRVKALARGGRRNIEADLLHGQSQTGWGVITNIGATVSGVTPLTISAATFAVGLYAGSNNQTMNVFDPTLATLRTADLAITQFDPDARIVYVTGTVGSIQVNDVIFPDLQTTTSPLSGTPALNQQIGLMTAASYTSGTIYNIDVGANYLYRPSQFDCASGPLKMLKILKGAAKGITKGVTGDLMLLIAPEHFEPLNDDLAALRQFDTSYKETIGTTGVSAIKYRYQSGTIMIAVHNYMKPSEAVMFPYESETVKGKDRACGRIGSSDLTFQSKGSGEQIFFDLQDNAAREMRVFSDQAIFPRKLGHVTRFYNIVNA